ncbi:hypothetical protein LTR56_010671 [Elasticomyces elasticus]|nr:hypothetical protein LTR56_010671 [Elasticomyces elasticus]KAK3655395.1 hypothetical protein LTR22_010280 [Elasticomyces elasticus]KAK4922129.1 hypothetical protein LTR49_010540 [Elasticomyces elasticus]KAK5751549.1 hypothetical protein LTS12_018391 [Elasticomyces elasticus]
MASARTAANTQMVAGLPSRRRSLASRQFLHTPNDIGIKSPRASITAWDLESVPSLRNAAERVRQANENWQAEINSADQNLVLENERNLDRLRTERAHRDAAQRVSNEERVSKIAEDERVRAEARNNAREAELAVERARVAEEARKRQIEAQVRSRAEEQRRQEEEAVNLVLALEESERLERLDRLEREAAVQSARLLDEADQLKWAREAEAAAEVARLAEEEDERQRRREAEALAEMIRLIEEAEQAQRLQDAEAAAEVARVAAEAEDRIRRQGAEAAAEVARLAAQVQETIRRREAEAARIAAEAERSRRQAQAEEERRRSRLRDCAVCLEQHDMGGMVQLTCQHWYCHDDLRVLWSKSNTRQIQYTAIAKVAVSSYQHGSPQDQMRSLARVAVKGPVATAKELLIVVGSVWRMLLLSKRERWLHETDGSPVRAVNRW